MRHHVECRRLVVATAGVAAIVVAGALTVTLLAQSPSAADRPTFEVASIKRNQSRDSGEHIGVPAGRFTATNVTVKTLIKFAYNGNQGGFSLRDDQISEGPSWVDSEKYDIDAKVQDSLVEEQEKKLPFDQWIVQIRLMLQVMLEDRFKLKVSHDTRELPVYVLVVAKNGPKLTPSTVAPIGPLGSSPPGSAPLKGPLLGVKRDQATGQDQMTGLGMAVGPIAELLSRQPELGGRMVLDQTGLKDTYDFALIWAPENPTTVSNGPDSGQAPTNSPLPDSSAPSIFTAIEEQLGLRLESTKGPVDVLVIDHIEEPSAN